MIDPNGHYGTRWGRVVLVLLPVLLVVGGIGVSVARGVLAASVVAQSSETQLATKGLRGDGVGLIIATNPTKQSDGQITNRYVRRLGVGKAVVDGLCLAQSSRVLGQQFTTLITATDDKPSTYEISAAGLLIDVASVQGYVGTTGETSINKNAADVRIAGSPIMLNGDASSFGLQAQTIDLRDVTANVQDIEVPDALSAPTFSVRIVPGEKSCPPPGQPSKR